MTDNKNLEYKRHTLAHLLAASVQDLYPDVKLTLGPAIDTGFYYDMEFSEPISDKDLAKIEKRMKKKIPQWNAFEHKEVSPEEAREVYKDNPYKLELINDIVERGEKITLYTIQGFTDLCRGGHTENPAKEIKAATFALDKVAGAYWRGDEKNPMLTRIYGFAFETADELQNHLEMIEEAKKRDHRKIGKEMNLFTFSDLVGPGLPLFTPKGTLIRDLIVEKIQDIQKDFGYQKVTIPHITKSDLYKTSGHYDKYGDDLFKVKGHGDTEFCMKPMNCPHHTQIFAASPRSYKELPIRYTETGVVYRDEQAGELLGLSRVRAISQDDGHVFCTEDQIEQEVKTIVFIIKEFYSSLGMLDENYWVSLSVRDPGNREKYIGDDNLWDKAESILEQVAKTEDLPYKKVEGEAAFYGPKLDFQFRDALGREWQLGTAQLDFNMPRRFDLVYTDSNGDKQTPVMIHRAIAGSLERFMALAIEHFAGHFPFWLAPVQVAVLPVNEGAHGAYGEEVFKILKENGVRVEIWTEDSLGKRIRRGKTEKIPYLLVLGDAEMEAKTITAEGKSDEKHEGITLDEFMKIADNK
jgi:threonyl-tRNA synthetase